MRKKNVVARAGQSVIAGGFAPLMPQSRIYVSGAENIPEAPFPVFMPVHDGAFSIFPQGIALRRESNGLIVITGKRELDLPVFGRFINALGCEFIDRKKKAGESPESRREYIRARYEAQARRALAMPNNRGVTMIFPEGTRHPQLTMIHAGALALAGCVAEELGDVVPAIPLGSANLEPATMMRHMVRPRHETSPSFHFGEPIWFGPGFLERYVEGGHEAVQEDVEMVRHGLERATNSARARVGLAPLEYVGNVGTARERRAKK